MSEQSVENFMRERVRQALEHPSKAVSSLAFSPDSTLLAIGTSDNRILLFGVANGVLVDGWNAIHSLVEHNRRKYKKVLDQRAVDPSTFLAIDIFLRNSTKVFSLAFRPGKVLQQGVCAALGEGSVGFWDLHGKQIKMWREDDKPVTNVVFSCDGQLMVSLGWKGITIRRFVTGQETQKIVIDNPTFSRPFFAMSYDSLYLALSSHERYIDTYTVSGERLGIIPLYYAAHYEEDQDDSQASFEEKVSAMVWNCKENLLVIGTDKGNIQVWQPIGEERVISVLKSGYNGPVEALISLLDGYLAFIATEEELLLWRPSDNHIVPLLKEGNAPVSKVSDCMFNADGTLLAVGSEDDEVFIWSTDGKLVSSFHIP